MIADGITPTDKAAAPPQVVPPAVMQRYLPPDLLRSYEESLVRHFLHESESWQPCPRHGCTNAVHCPVPPVDPGGAACQSCNGRNGRNGRS